MPALENLRLPSSSIGSGSRGPLEQSSSTNTTHRAPYSTSGPQSKMSAMSQRSVSAAVPQMSSIARRDENNNYGNDSSENDDELGVVPRKPSAMPRARRSLGGAGAASSSSGSRIASTNHSSHRSSSRADGNLLAPSSETSGVSAYPSSGPATSTSRTASSSHANRSGMSALARANANARRVSLAPPGLGGVGAGASGPLEAVKKLNVDSTSFDEWMKMATDNKINPTNTFSIALIDYFHDMSLLRSDSGDGSINFQKASCTLDGCVKVWTSRVDSVVTETGKLLNGLVGDGRGTADEEDDGSGELELDEDGNPIAARGKKEKKKRARAKEATLVKNFSAIAVKKLDLEYTVDPLFKKTSADFDEGGAGGLLMNHLGVDDDMRVVFDAGEAPGLAAADEEIGEEELETHFGSSAQQVVDRVDLDRLTGKLFGDNYAAIIKGSFDPLSELLQGRMVCPSLSRFSFAFDQERALFGQETEDSDADEDVQGNYLNPMVTATPWGGNDDVGNAIGFGSPGLLGTEAEDSGGDLFGVPAELEGDAEVFGLPAEGPSSFSRQSRLLQNERDRGVDGENFDVLDGDDGHFGMDVEEGAEDVNWDPRQGPSQHDLLLAFKGVSGNDDEGQDDARAGAQAGGGLFDYFDKKMMKSWAGPEHWKMRSRLVGFGGFQSAHQQGVGQAGGEAAETASAMKKKRTAKEAFVIDFTSEDSAVSAKELFEAPRSTAATILPKTISKPEAYLLPEDRHFTSRMLLRLFSKPRAVLNIRTRKGAVRFGGPDVPGFVTSGDGEVDGEFWARQQAAREADGFDFVGGDGNGAMPLDTQFYHDGDDEGAFEVASSMPQQSDPNSAFDVDVADYEEADLAAQAAAMKRVKPEYVNYAKKAKRVDVRKLKENIWKELGIEDIVATSESHDLRDEEDGSDNLHTPRSSSPSSALSALQPKTFRSVLSGLRKAYPKEKMEEISTSFCFICLLHLANEEGLEIKIGEQGGSSGLNARKLNGAFKTPGRIMEEDEDDDEDGQDGGNADTGEDDDDEDWTSLPVGRLEYLRIKKDPTAGRSA